MHTRSKDGAEGGRDSKRSRIRWTARRDRHDHGAITMYTTVFDGITFVEGRPPSAKIIKPIRVEIGGVCDIRPN